MPEMISFLLYLSFILLYAYGMQISSSNLLPYSSSNPFSDPADELSVQMCKKYTCKLPTQEFVSSTCGYYGGTEPTVYAQPCPNSSTYCKLNTTSLNYTCQPFIPTYYSFPGDKCSPDKECYEGYSQSCTDGICVGLKKGKPCTSSYQCDPNSSCRNIDGTLQCAPLLEIGQTGCYKEFDCVYNAGCNVTSTTDLSKNTCIPYGSIPPGTEISIETCSWSENLCSSHICVQKTAGDETAICSGNIESSSQMPASCILPAGTTLQCQSKLDNYTDTISLSNCLCGYNSGGNSYCELFPGDVPMQAYYRELKKWQESSAIKNCNTYWRYPIDNGENLLCIKNNYDKARYESLYYWYLYSSLYPQIYGAEDCVLKTFFPDYFQAGENGGDGKDSSARGIALVSLLLILNH
ncbi:unnamed protein product [Blepharisma stoltei]|uniref:Dickkopf N-terminal cysteine-rich domain-containing protein n=1 Tax=Blepharisma stoltei TaxID=1481888 RepID=A0AAU9IB41_9CILI|nr:unnamed protein product [Blepharisma stoltei]